VKVCVLGATGKSGRRIVRAALQQGFSVTALVRDAAKAADLTHERLTVRAASFSDEAALAEIIRGHDAAVNAAGYVTEGAAYETLIRGVIRAVEQALGPGGRFWLFGGAALLDVPGTSLTTLDLPGVPKVFEAHRRNFHAVKATSLDWSMLCPGPMLDAPDGAPTAGLVVSDDVWPVARPALTGFLPRIATSLAFKNALPRMTIYYEDAAQVIVRNLEKGGPHSHKRVGVALPPGERRTKNDLPA
jgi:putative NADH-flavin reductase